MPTRTAIDRSLAFTVLLECPGFGNVPDRASGQIITDMLEAWYASDGKDMYRFAREWWTARPATMAFTLTVRYPDGSGSRESHDLVTMQDELTAVSRVLSAMVPGEVIEIRRIT